LGNTPGLKLPVTPRGPGRLASLTPHRAEPRDDTPPHSCRICFFRPGLPRLRPGPRRGRRVGRELSQAAGNPPAPPHGGDAILGQDVASGGTVVGRLIDLLVGEDGQPRAAVLDVGGFMGMGARDVTVDWSTLHFAPTEKQHPITTTLSPDQIRSAPEYKNPDQPAAVVVQPK